MRHFVVLTLVLSAVASVLPARAQSGDDRYTIMRPEPGTTPQPRPEPWLVPTYKSPRGTKQHPSYRQSTPAPALPRAEVPPALLVPETGRVLPNLPAVSGAGRGGAETYQDRAVRCAHQAGVYGQAAGSPSAYINSCINQ